jgi:hypothetical protein
MKPLATFVLILICFGTAFSQDQSSTYFISAGKGLSFPDWKLRYIGSAGIELPLEVGFSISASLNYLEFPAYENKGNDRVISNSTKSEISVAVLLKLSPPWTVAPYIAGGFGFARESSGQVVMSTMTENTRVVAAQDGLALFASIKMGVEIAIFRKFIVGANLFLGIGSELYSDNIGSQFSIRFGI